MITHPQWQPPLGRSFISTISPQLLYSRVEAYRKVATCDDVLGSDGKPMAISSGL